MNDPTTFLANGKQVKVPYRSNGMFRLPADKLKRLCLKSRSHDGYERESAIKELLLQALPVEALPFVLVSLTDYVIEVSRLPVDAPEIVVANLKKLVKDNQEVIATLEPVIISYWNVYYRDRYTWYQNYPPYKFLISLRSK